MLESRINSVSSPCAQNTKLCNVQDKENVIMLKAKALIEEYLNSCPVLSYFISLQMMYGLRVSETLNISSGDILFNGSISLRVSKGGENRIIVPIIGLDYFLRCRRGNVMPFKDFNRYWIYRLYKRYNIVLDQGDNKKKSVTHAFRHVNTSMLRKDKVDKDIIKKSLGHKKEKTQEYYGKNQKRDNNNT